jgi:ketosteroid isomerase-like protein
MSAAETEATARQLVAEYNKGTPGWVAACHADTTVWRELPILGGAGRSGGRAALQAAADGAVVVFPDRRMEIISVIAGEDRAALEVDWTATAAQDTPWAKAGEKLHFRAVMLLKVVAGRVVEEIDYVVPM